MAEGEHAGMHKLFVFTAALLLTACTTASGGQITSFEECVAAGNPVMESYPRQCRAGDTVFVEEIDEPVNPDAE